MTPISATGIWTAESAQGRRDRQRGFTLLEVLVTLALVGIVTGFAVLSLPGGGEARRLEEAARQLAARITLNRQEALLLGEQRGLRFGPRGYGFWTWQDAWTAADETYPLPPGVELELAVEGRRAALDSALPQVLLLSSGEATAFSATLRLAGQRRTVSGDPLGRVRWDAP